MKRLLLLIVAFALPAVCLAKPQATRYTYYVYEYSSAGRDTSFFYVLASNGRQCLFGKTVEGKAIPGYADVTTFIAGDSIYRQHAFDNGSRYFSSLPYDDGGLEWNAEPAGNGTVRYTANINSNKMELEMAANGADANPVPYYGKKKGTLLRFVRNGQVYMELGKTERLNDKQLSQRERALLEAANDPSSLGTRSDARAIARMKQERMVLAWRIFDTVQLHWGATTARRKEMPRDTAIHFAGGTLVLKRVSLPALPSHYQWFAELHEKSNGDAYDRTGSIFVIPQGAERTFFQGIGMHPDSLPSFVGRDGERYQGMVSLFEGDKASYLAPIELARFFTPFGVSHYNDRVHVDGITWQEEAYYKQEITDISSCLQGDVWIGAYIGNYDGGGHKLSLDLKAYPQSEQWTDSNQNAWTLPLFNTCNVLEMAGQNYGKFFRTDSLNVRFFVPENVGNLRLRYIATGHGGWDTGDEFVPKESHILLDGQLAFRFTPWRTDCGTYRDKNPVSGNFWNGTSSSDGSRSGWCPGTATQPAYFDLSSLAPGWHTITVAIPEGDPIEGGFSYWNVSGALTGIINK